MENDNIGWSEAWKKCGHRLEDLDSSILGGMLSQCNRLIKRADIQEQLVGAMLKEQIMAEFRRRDNII